MDIGERYYQLSLLGRISFLESVAGGALLLHPSPTAAISRLARGTTPPNFAGEKPGEESTEVAVPLTPVPTALPSSSTALGRWTSVPREVQSPSILPICKKLGTPFVDLITLGRTAANDIHLPDPSVSRFQAFFRLRLGHWYLCDAGSKNGTVVDGKELATRTEVQLKSGVEIFFGCVPVTFHSADSLYDYLTQ